MLHFINFYYLYLVIEIFCFNNAQLLFGFRRFGIKCISPFWRLTAPTLIHFHHMDMSGQDIPKTHSKPKASQRVIKNGQRKVQKMTSKEQSAPLRININMWPRCGVSQEACMDPILKSSQAVNVLAEAGACCGTQMLWSPH